MTEPSETAKEALLKRLSAADRKVLAANISLITARRGDAMQLEFSKQQNAAAAGKWLNSSRFHGTVFDAAIRLAESAAEDIIQAAFTAHVRAKDDGLLADFVCGDLEFRLRAFAMSNFGHDGQAGRSAAAFMAVGASARAAQFRHRVVIARAAFEEKQGDYVERIKRGALKRPWIALPVAAILAITWILGKADANLGIYSKVKGLWQSHAKSEAASKARP